MAKPDIFCNRAAAAEAHDDVPRSPEASDTIGDIIVKRYSRREMMRGTLGVAAAAALFGPAALAAGKAEAAGAGDRFNFEELNDGVDANHHVATGYRGQVLIRWGDPLFPDSPAFNPTAQSAAAQLKQFGYNNDYVAFFPLDGAGKRGLLCVNHEYTNEEVMFPGISKRQDTSGFEDIRLLVDIEMAAHGVSIVEIARDGEDWRVVLDSPYNRRISPGNTEMKADGPAAGDPRLKTGADPSGKTIFGTLNNCARRKDAVGDLSHRRGEFPRLFLVGPFRTGWSPPQGPRRRSGQELRPLRHPWALAGLGQIPRPLQRRQGAERTEPLRLDRPLLP
jgi:hypothetical protein